MQKIPSGKFKPSLIALDLDDTLLHSDLSISDFSCKMLQKAAENGIFVVLCSGRSASAILPHVRRLDIAGATFGKYIIAQNGCEIFDLHERKSIYAEFLPHETFQKLESLVPRDISVSVYNDDTIFTSFDSSWVRLDAQLTGLKIEVEPDFFKFAAQRDFSKAVVASEPKRIENVQSVLRDKLSDCASIYTSKPFFLEIMPKTAGKGVALQILAEKFLKISAENILCFGDSYNDESMLTYAGKSVAMKNGIEPMQKIARWTTEFSNDEDGVAKFIEKFVDFAK